MMQTGLRAGAAARFFTRMPSLLLRHLWVWPVFGAVLLMLVGIWVHKRIEGAMKVEIVSRLQTLLNADVASLRLWFSGQMLDAHSLTIDPRVQQAVVELAALAAKPGSTVAAVADCQSARSLREYLMPQLQAQQYVDYVVIGTDRRILASPRRQAVGRPAPRGYELFMERALAGQLAVSRPFPREAGPEQRIAEATMFVAAPVKSAKGQVVAVLGLRMKPEDEFSRIFSIARMGKTGESYAFDARGLMLTASRFDSELKRQGVIPNAPGATAILNVRLAEPAARYRWRGDELRKGEGAPLTRMAMSATRGRTGYDVNGYPNYRGVEVVGAWTWLPEYGMGVATEISAAEAFQTLRILRQAFYVLFGMLIVSGAGIVVFTLVVDRLQRRLRRAALAERRLGPYMLIEEIGRGANGMVYRARHALLRRPVAIKLLDPELTNVDNAARFEHEVQITSQLTHPNTVAVYDYGRSPEGLFYYAMEYLSGIDLDQLVRRFGPQPEGRVVHILRQICGSLAEAHRHGLVHRDIKPGNIMLTRRGGACDVVKVLDFGLVKARQPSLDAPSRADAKVEGTPHFISPEAVAKPDTMDARSDLYSAGAVAYWLLTGSTLFDLVDVRALLQAQVSEQPIAPSQRLGQPVSPELESLILCCLAKEPGQRPQSAEGLLAALDQCVTGHAWTPEDSERWWTEHMAGLGTASPASMPEKTLVIAAR